MVTQLPDGTVEFRFCRPGAHYVTLAGDFNGWHKTSLPMRKGRDGWWQYQLRLAPGCYQFRYIADQEWYTDYAAFGLEHGPFGLNSVVKVESRPLAETRDVRQPVVRFPSTAVADRQLLRQAGFSTRDVASADDWSVDETAEALSAVAG
jgi:1,4-alpha-glucan branching enzyme